MVLNCLLDFVDVEQCKKSWDTKKFQKLEKSAVSFEICNVALA